MQTQGVALVLHLHCYCYYQYSYCILNTFTAVNCFHVLMCDVEAARSVTETAVNCSMWQLFGGCCLLVDVWNSVPWRVLEWADIGNFDHTGVLTGADYRRLLVRNLVVRRWRRTGWKCWKRKRRTCGKSGNQRSEPTEADKKVNFVSAVFIIWQFVWRFWISEFSFLALCVATVKVWTASLIDWRIYSALTGVRYFCWAQVSWHPCRCCCCCAECPCCVPIAPSLSRDLWIACRIGPWPGRLSSFSAVTLLVGSSDL